MRDGLEQVFAVVEHQQQRASANGLGDAFARQHAVDGHHAQRAGNRRRDEFRPAQGTQFRQPHAIRKTLQHVARDFEPESRLADAAGADERQQAMLRDELADLVHDVLAADEFGDPFGKIGRHARMRDGGGRFDVGGLHITGELVAASRDGTHQVAVFAQRLAKGRDVGVQAVVLHHAPRPNAVHELFVVEDLSLAFDQGDEQVERPAADLDRHPVFQQFAAGGHHGVPAEREHSRRCLQGSGHGLILGTGTTAHHRAAAGSGKISLIQRAARGAGHFLASQIQNNSWRIGDLSAGSAYRESSMQLKAGTCHAGASENRGPCRS